MAKIPKLGSQWRIIYDFKPTEYLQAADISRSCRGLYVITGESRTPGRSYFATYFPFPKICLAHGFHVDNNQAQIQPAAENNQILVELDVESTQLPKVGEWTRVEIGHEKVDEKYFLSLSVGGREVARMEVTDPKLRKLTDVKIGIGSSLEECRQPGFIRRLVVLEK